MSVTITILEEEEDAPKEEGAESAIRYLRRDKLLHILLAKDPVHTRMLKLVVKNAIDRKIILYTKVNLVKLAAINKAKTSNLEDAELASMMTSVSLARSTVHTMIRSTARVCHS
jgi:hypothetical protein